MGIILVCSSIPEKIWYTGRSMSEIDSSPENLNIPQNWNFPDKGRRDLKIIQFDQEQRFLAFTLQNRPTIKNPDYR